MKEPEEKVPTELPEPALGMNFVRNRMQIEAWLSFIAAHSDAWLLSVFFVGAQCGFDEVDRFLLFLLIYSSYFGYKTHEINLNVPIFKKKGICTGSIIPLLFLGW